MLKKDVVVIGGGPAGMAAAVAAYDAGCKDVLILERENALGGILKQCIHNGFGLHNFGEELTGPEYAKRYKDEVEKRNIPYMTDTTVLSIDENKNIVALNSEKGVVEIEAKSIILCMGCRERPRGALSISGTRPAGVFTAGAAQKFVNIKGYLPGREVVILGSGDIGLIMARRMTLEGAHVKAVCELMPYSGGLARNIEQCLNDFNIPLKLSHTVVKVHGEKRVTGVTIARVDEKRCPIKETEEFIPCDTLLLSVGLIPENELTTSAGIALDPITNGAFVDQNRETGTDGVFAAGNVLHVHDLADFASKEAETAGCAAAEYVKSGLEKTRDIKIKTDGKVRYTVPQRITADTDVKMYFRVSDVFKNVTFTVKDGEEVIFSKKAIGAAPGEMEEITLKKETVEKIKSGEITVGLEAK
ncbi:MAG: FAD-dependent oxidoreductase [Clostridia bacterium]|nr:FAD-dependent oxidoreductase [Clostridia bacterium]